MGKKLIIKGADFHKNAVGAEPLDITSLIGTRFKAGYSLRNLQDLSPDSNTKRCCIVATTFESLGIDISRYSLIILDVKSGFDYVFGTGPVRNSSAGWQGWDGSTGGKGFVWVTDNQRAVATVDATTLCFSANFRYDDNTTEFSQSTVISDIVNSITLIP